MKPLFRINYLILDDTPQVGVELTKQRLQEIGCDVQILQRPIQIIENTEALLEAHIVLCDLTFYNFGAAGEAAFISQNPSSDKKQFVSDWILALQRWCSTADKTGWSEINKTPGAQIEAQDIGFWLAAMVSQINPDCEIVFYTSAIKEITGPLSAIAQFRGSRFGVETKNPDASITESAINKALTRRQKRLLESSPQVYRWFLRKVFLPVLMGKMPIEGNASQLSVANPSKEFSLKADLFFPQFKGEEISNKTKEFFREFLICENWELQSWEMRALQSLEHDLREEKCDFYSRLVQEKRVDYLDRLLVAAVDAGTVGQGILALLETAREELEKSGKWPSELLELAHKFCCRAMRNSERDLEDLCKDLQNSEALINEGVEFFLVDDACAVEPDSPAELSDPGLPFPIAYFQRVISALRHNLETNLKNKQGSPWFSLRARVGEESLAIIWEDNSEGFASIEDFRAAVVKSSSKDSAEHRGLPLAILFGVEFGAEIVHVLIRDKTCKSGPDWNLIYSTNDAMAPDAFNLKKQTGFGFYWKFKHPRQ